MATLIVCRDRNIDKFGWGVSVTEGNNWDIDITGLLDGLGVGARIRDDDEAGFFEGASDVVGEVTGSKPAGNGYCTSMGSELEHSALAVGAGGDNADVGWVVNRGDNAGSEYDLFPGSGGSIS